MQTVYRRMEVEWSGLEYADCLQKNGSSSSGVEYAECLQKSGSCSGSGVEWSGLEYADCFRRVVLVVEWSMQTVYRRMVVVVEWNKQNVYRRVVLLVVVVVMEWSMQTVYRRMVSEWSGLEYADCLQKIGSEVEWTGVCRRFTEEW